MDTEALSLTIIGPPSLSGAVLRIDAGRQVLGRNDDADLQIDDHLIDARHATIDHFEDRVVVEDLGSAHGTWVGGVRLSGVREIHDGDIITFGRVEVRLERNTEPFALPHKKPRPPPTSAGSSTSNSSTSNDGDFQQRERFLREVTTSRAWARFVFCVGVVTVLVGTLGCAWFLAEEPGAPSDPMPTGLPAFGPDTELGPVGSIFVIVGFVGHFVLILGAMLWIIAAAHVRRIDTDSRYPWNAPLSG
ncbi:MAG: FHA domain-containing protein [Rhodococcus sp. (in: high G+C Gram-positive bacteria)]|uniref:FHA domain-containing protein n=1 Tax=Rhodococcus sp. TaxID=1831 RepID=UPI003BB7A3D2